MQNIYNCYQYKTTECANFANFHCLYNQIKDKLQIETGDNLILVTCKIKVPEKYWISYVRREDTIYIAQEMTEYIIKQINERMNRQNNPFHDMALLKIIENFFWGIRGYAETTGNNIFFYDIINVKHHNMNDIKKLVGYNSLGKNKKFKIAYESATGTEGKYKKPFNKHVYLETIENPENFLLEFIECNQNVNLSDSPQGIYFGDCKFNTVRNDYSIFRGRLQLPEKSNDNDWVMLKTKSEIESENKRIQYELEHPIIHKSVTAEEVLDMIANSVI